MTTKSRIVNPVWGKVQSAVFFLCGSFISFLAGREYYEIIHLNKPARHPFGRIEQLIQNADKEVQQGISIEGLDYPTFMLYLCIASFLVGGIFVVSWFFDKAMKFAYLTLFAVAGYFIYKKYM